MLNKYTWELYLRSGGNDVVNFFENQLSEQYSVKYADFVVGLHKAYCPMQKINDWIGANLREVCDRLSNEEYLLSDGEYCIESALDELYAQILSESDGNIKTAFGKFAYDIVIYTTLLSVELSELFVPYYFQYNFNVLERIAKEFSIELPDIPVKSAYKERILYYGDICAALYDFRIANGLSPYELCAFLYDFAPQYIGGLDSYIIKDIPEPIGAYFIGSDHNDLFLADDVDEICCWQCSTDTMPGDIIVMYMRSPVSRIDSVWRSVSSGFSDPFFYYYRCTYIAKPKRVRPISLKELRTDPIYRELPIVRKNMQGVNGVELVPTVYYRMVNDFGINIPKLRGGDFVSSAFFENEKDVENRLIRPLLDKLRYTSDDYVQQMVMWIGNHNAKEIPDFVVLPKVSPRHQSAYYLIEAKHSITTKSQLEDAKQQARSYAKQLSARYTVIASQERLWVTSASDDYSETVLEADWAELNDPNCFHKLFSLIGKKTN